MLKTQTDGMNENRKTVTTAELKQSLGCGRAAAERLEDSAVSRQCERIRGGTWQGENLSRSHHGQRQQRTG